MDAVNTLQTKRGMTVMISRPPSRREKTTDPLTFNLINVVEVLRENEMDVYDLFPEFELEKEEMITSDDIIHAMKVYFYALRLKRIWMVCGIKGEIRDLRRVIGFIIDLRIQRGGLIII